MRHQVHETQVQIQLINEYMSQYCVLMVVQFNYSLYRTSYRIYLRRPDLALRLADAPDAEPPRENELGLDDKPPATGA